jgi:hypothetical protein
MMRVKSINKKSIFLPQVVFGAVYIGRVKQMNDIIYLSTNSIPPVDL